MFTPLATKWLSHPDIVDAERKMAVAPSPQIRRVLARIVRWRWSELEQLDFEVRLGSFATAMGT